MMRMPQPFEFQKELAWIKLLRKWNDLQLPLEPGGFVQRTAGGAPWVQGMVLPNSRTDG